jgi:hypothetical protein
MMSRFIPLNPKEHVTHGWKRFDSMAFAEHDVCAPIVLAELKMLLPHYPLAFIRNGEQRFTAVALQGVYAKQNLMISPQGKWLVPYIPSVYRGYPFALQQVDQAGEAHFVLCFDSESGLYREMPDAGSGNERFFDDDAQLTTATRGVLDFLMQRQRSQAHTQIATDLLAELGLLKPLSWPFASPDKARTPVTGLYRVNEQALSELKDDDLARLARSDALMLGHAQLLSMPRFDVLPRLYRLHYPPAAEPAGLDQIEQLFGDKDDTLKFNF